MLTVDAFPVAVHEKQTTPESPDFLSQVERLEQLAIKGVETYQGKESLQFRAGIEIEFALIDPEKWRTAIAENEANSQATHEEFIRINDITDPDRVKVLANDHERRNAQSRKYRIAALKNPDLIQGKMVDTLELVDDFKVYATEYIQQLPAVSDAEIHKKEKWLTEIPSFGVSEVINFLIYEEFSKPTLADNVPPNTGNLDDLDSYSDSQGWLEFRFGTGTLQSGYYDNEGMCEIRLAPCAPSEAIRRKATISARMTEIASQFGVLLQTTPNHEHINLSVYSKNDDGNYVPVVGHDKQHRDKTLDITAGIAKSFQEGLWLHKEDMTWGHNFDPKNGPKFTFSPGRKSLRIMNGRVELRSRFYQDDQALNWLVAGAVIGLRQGHEGVKNEGLSVPEISNIYRVHRGEDFDKQSDLQIQRAFENAEVIKDARGEKFVLNMGYNMIRGESIAISLIGEQEDMYGCDAFNEAVLAGIAVKPDGVPYLDPMKLKKHCEELVERRREYVDKFFGSDWESTITQINKRLTKVRLEPTEVIAGDVLYNVGSQQEAAEHLSQSDSAKLAYGDNLESVISWLESGVPTK